MLQIKLFTSSWVLTIGTASVALILMPPPPLGGPLLPPEGCKSLSGSGTSETSSKALLLEALVGANQRALYSMFDSFGVPLGAWKQWDGMLLAWVLM